MSPAARPTFSGEAAMHSAISRAYYAAFRVACDYAIARLGYLPRGTGADHGALCERLRRTNRPQLAQMLARLQQWREQCDCEGTDLDNGSQMARDVSATGRSYSFSLRSPWGCLVPVGAEAAEDALNQYARSIST